MATERTNQPGASVEHQPDAGVQNRVGKPKPRGWREIEALRERQFLKESLADVWDDDIVIDESVFSNPDRECGYYSNSEDVDIEEDMSDFDDEDDIYDDDD